MGSFISVLSLAISVLTIVAIWQVYERADQPGWAAVIPIYNWYVLFEIADKPAWWLLLMLVPIVNIVIWIIANIGLAAYFSRSAGFGVGLALLPMIFFPILAFTEG